MGNGGTEQGASILITVKRKSHTHYTFKRFSYSFLMLLRGARMKPGKEHFNAMFYFKSCFVLTFFFVRYADFTSSFLSDTFRL